MNTKVIDETTLRSGFPWVPKADLTIPLIAASSSKDSIETIVAFQDEATNAQGPPLLLITHSPSYTYDVYTM